MKNNKRGFTLVELLVVIAIMGLLSIMVFPSVSKLIKQNKDKQFEYYKETLLAAAKIYYNQKEPDLAFEEWTGCIEISYDDLLKANLLSPMSKDYNCSTSKVRITKNSNETYQVYLTCTDNDGKLVYNKGGSPSGVCNPEPVEHSYVLSDVLIDEDKRGSGCKVTSKVDYTDVGFDIYHDYLTGNCQNNYVWYHGNLYRAYEIRSAKGVFNI